MSIRILFIIGLLAAGVSQAQRVGSPTGDLTDTSVEDLFRLEVTSVGRKAQELSKAPSAVFVLTADDIRRSGATSIPEALEWVPGLTVERVDGRMWAISARGSARVFLRQNAGHDRRPFAVHAAFFGRLVGPGGRAARKHRAHRDRARAGRRDVGSQRGERSDQHHHQEIVCHQGRHGERCFGKRAARLRVCALERGAQRQDRLPDLGQVRRSPAGLFARLDIFARPTVS